MLAHHPLTGKPIRVVKSRAQLWRDAKTMVLLNMDSDPAIPWSRWETAAAGLSVVKGLIEKGIEVHVPILIHEPGLDIDTLISLSNKSHLIVISAAIIKTIGPEAFRNANLGNVLCLEEFKEIYAYCGEVWNGTAEDAAIITCAVLHYSRIAGVRDAALALRKEPLERMKITSLGFARPPALCSFSSSINPISLRVVVKSIDASLKI